MPLYEYRKNATNHVTVPHSIRQEVACGTGPVLDRVLSLIRDKRPSGEPAVAAIDGWYGVDWMALQAGLRQAAHGFSLEIISTAGLFKSADEIEAYRRPFVTDDPSFGYVNSKGTIEDVLDQTKLAALRQRLSLRKETKADMVLVVGPGAAIAALQDLYDLRFYADFTMQPLLWQMWDGKLVTFGSEVQATNYQWKKYYYCDFYLLLRQKKTAFARMEYYIEEIGRAHV